MATADKYVIDFSDPIKDSFSIKAYTSNGPIFPTFTDSGLINPKLAGTSIAANTSLLLYGKGVPDYGERIGENFVHLLENFSGPAEPVVPISGQLWYRVRNYWYDSGSTFWYEWNGTAWNTIVPTGGPTGSPADGTFSTASGELYRYTVANDSASWIKLASTTAAFAPTLGSPDAIPDADLMLYNGNAWLNVSGTVTSGPTAPSGSTEGDLWFDTDPSDDPWTYSQLKIYDGAWESTARNYLMRDGDTLNGVLNVGSPSLMNITGTPTNGTDVVPYSVILALGSDDINNDSTVTGVTVTDALDNLVKVSGDDMTGDLAFDTNSQADRDVLLRNAAGSAPRQFVGYTDDSVAVNKFYVDSVLGGVGDTYLYNAGMGITSGSPYVGDPNTLYLWVGTNADIPVPNIALVGHTHDAVDITNSPNGSISATNVQAAINELDDEKAPIDSPTFTGQAFIGGTLTLQNDPIDDREAASKQYVDNNTGNIRRIMLDTSGSPIEGPYTVPSYVVGRNQTFVTVAGIKQYQSFRGYQDVLLSALSGNTGMAPAIDEADPVLDEFILAGDHTTKFLTGLTFEVVESTSAVNDGSYVVLSDSTLTAEVSQVVVVAESGSPISNIDGAYFTLSSSIAVGNDYYVWFNVDAGGNDPLQGDIPIEVAVTSGDSAITIASALRTALNSAGSPSSDFTATILGSPSDTVIITNNVVGSVPSSILDGTAPDETGFGFSVLRSGGNTIVPVTTAIPAVDTVGRASPDYQANITIDGTPTPVVLSGKNISTYDTFVSALTTAIDPTGTSTLLVKDVSIRVTSESFGSGSPLTGSSINIVDAVFAGSPTSELPLFSSLADYVSILPAVDGARYGYQEVGVNDTPSTMIVFEPGNPPAGIIEVLIY